jgi:hypothetical protein
MTAAIFVRDTVVPPLPDEALHRLALGLPARRFLIRMEDGNSPNGGRQFTGIVHGLRPEKAPFGKPGARLNDGDYFDGLDLKTVLSRQISKGDPQCSRLITTGS